MIPHTRMKSLKIIKVGGIQHGKKVRLSNYRTKYAIFITIQTIKTMLWKKLKKSKI